MKMEIEALCREHRNIERMLDAMVATLKQDGDETWACKFLSAALAYLGGFERDTHHRKEQALFKRLVALDATLQEAQDRLTEHGKLLRDMEKDLHCSVSGHKTGDAVSRARLKQQVAAYREAYRNRTAVEEGLLYHAACSRLKPSDWRQLFGKFAHVEDPVFGRRACLKFPDAALMAYEQRGRRRFLPGQAKPPAAR